MENNQDARLISSERGGNLIILKSHKYRLIRRRKDGLEKWTCTNNKCTVSLVIEGKSQGTNLISVREVLGEHCHSTIANSKIERQLLWANCKRRALESVSTTPVKIIRTELMKDIYTTVIQHQDIRSLRQAI